MRALLAPIGTTGDMLILASIGVALREQGWEVAACTTRDFRHLFESRGIRFESIDVDAKDLVGGLDGGIVDLLQVGRRLRPAGKVALAALDGAVQDVDVVIGTGLQVFAPPLCASRGIRYAYASPAPINERGAGLPPPFLPFHGLGRVTNSLLWGAQNAVFDRLFGAIASDVYRVAGVTGRPKRLLESIAESPLVLGLYDAPIAGLDHRGAAPLGACVVGDDGPPIDPDLEAFLNAGPPPVLIGFGSMPAGDPRARTALVRDALKASGLRGVLDQGWGGLDQRIEGADHVYWSAGFTHRRLLPRVAAIVHHGGAGTTSTAARLGVPQVIVPHIADQFYFGRRIAALGAGPKPLPAKRLTGRRLVDRLNQAVNDPSIRANAAALAGRLQDVDGPKAAASALQDYVSR